MNKKITVLLSVTIFTVLLLSLTGCDLLITRLPDEKNFDASQIESFKDSIFGAIVKNEISVEIQEEILPMVSDAVAYTKNVVGIDDMSTEYYKDTPHEIIIPKINADTAIARSINEEIYDKYYVLIENLKSNEEKNSLYSLSYKYDVQNDIVTIFMICTIGYQFSYYDNYYDIYHYDIANGERIDLDGYISALNVDFKKLTEKVNSLNTNTLPYSITVPILNTWSSNTITDAFFSNGHTYVIYDYDGQQYYFEGDLELSDVTK